MNGLRIGWNELVIEYAKKNSQWYNRQNELKSEFENIDRIWESNQESSMIAHYMITIITSLSFTKIHIFKGNVVIPGLNVIDCSNITEVINCLEAGLVHRHTAAIHSHDPSASHAIFSLILEHQWTDPGQFYRLRLRCSGQGWRCQDW